MAKHVSQSAKHGHTKQCMLTVTRSDTKWARMIYVLQPAKPLEVAGQTFGEHLDDMEGVRSST